MSILPVGGGGSGVPADNSISNAKLADMAQATIKGRQASAGTGDPQDLTAAQARTAMGLGTAAEKNIPATGNASATEVVYGTDTRLTDPRTPLAHADSHAPGGSGELPWTTAHGRGTTVAKPAASAANAGYLYYDTDLSRLERSNGTTWDVLTTGGGGGTWGSITGTLSSQIDLQNALNAKADLSGGNTLAGTQTVQAAATQDAIKIAGRAGGTSSHAVTIIPLALSANRTLSAPDADGTIATLSAQTFTGAQQFPAGSSTAVSVALNDPDTGLYSAGSNTIGAACAGRRVLSITGSNFLHYGYGFSLPVEIVRANGTEAAPTKVLSGEDIGCFGFRTYYNDGAGGAGFSITGCQVKSWATEDHNGSTNLGQKLSFATIANGAGSASNRMILHEQGTLALGGVSSTTQYISPASIAGNAPKLQSLGTSNAGDSAYLQARFDATAGDCPQHVLAKSRGTALADYTTVASGDTLGIIAGEGADGTEFIRAGSIRCVVDGTVSTGVVPGSWVIYTNNASGTAVQAVKIDSSQNVAVAGNVSIGTGKQYQINGVQLAMEDLKTPADVTTNNATTSAHGLLPKLSGDTTQFLNGNGAWASGGLVASQVILKETKGSATTAWTVTLPVACKAVRVTCYLSNASGSGNALTMGVNGTSTGHAQNTGSDNGASVYGSESTSPYFGTVGASNTMDFHGVINVGASYTHANLVCGFQFATDNLTQGSKTFRIDNTADITSLTLTGNQTNGIGAGSYIIVERIDADVAPVFGVVFSGTADKTVANTTTETSLMPTGVGSATLAANSFSVGKVLKVRLAGRYGTKDAPAGNIDVKVKLGATVVNSVASHALDPSETDQYWRLELCLTCRTTGASGTVIGQTAWEHAALSSGNTAMEVASMVATGVVTVDTTASKLVDVTAQFSTANASNTITTTCCQIEWLN